MLAITLSILVFLAACNGNSEDETLNTAENAYDNIKELVDDYSGNTTTGKTASITSTELIVTDSDNNATAYDLPAEEFFVSIAPFINETHPCDIHSLTGCQGEMTNESFDIYIDRKSTRLNSSHVAISYAVFCLKKKKYIYKYRYNL